MKDISKMRFASLFGIIVLMYSILVIIISQFTTNNVFINNLSLNKASFISFL